MALKGILYRKIQERKLTKLKTEKQKFSKGTQQLLGKLNKTIEKELLRSEHSSDTKINSVIKALQKLISVNNKIARQNQRIISFLQKKKQIKFSV